MCCARVLRPCRPSLQAAIPIAVVALTRHPDDTAVVFPALQLLSRVLQSHGTGFPVDGPAVVSAAGGVLRQHTTNSDILRAALSCLSNLLGRHPDARPSAVPFVPAVVAATAHHPNDARVCGAAMGTLWNISSTAECARGFPLSAVSCVAAVLRTHGARDAKVAVQSMRCLQCLARHMRDDFPAGVVLAVALPTWELHKDNDAATQASIALTVAVLRRVGTQGRSEEPLDVPSIGNRCRELAAMAQRRHRDNLGVQNDVKELVAGIAALDRL